MCKAPAQFLRPPKMNKQTNKQKVLKKGYRGLKRWLGGREHRLLFQRTQVGFLTPAWQLTNICDSSFRRSDTFFRLPRVPGTRVAHTYISRQNSYI